MSNLPGSLHSGFYDGSAKVVLATVDRKRLELVAKVGEGQRAVFGLSNVFRAGLRRVSHEPLIGGQGRHEIEMATAPILEHGDLV